MAIDRIFPVVTARDAAATIELTLASLREFTEVIVYDFGSRDSTREICAGYPNVQLVDGDFLGGGRTRNHAASLAEGDWIFALDADEFLSDGLLASLRDLSLEQLDAAYSVHRHNLFMGKDIRWGGWGNEWRARLYNRHRYQFSDATVGERLVLASDTRVAPLKGALWHEAVPSLDVLMRDIGRRASLRQNAATKAVSPPLIAIRAIAAFWYSYLLKLGLLEGWRGLVIAVAASVETFFRLMQRYADRGRPLPRSATEAPGSTEGISRPTLGPGPS
ncbi:MAG: glycosyltransferase family 2 protein, partial [Gammaproteobacteria bacterium]|nr:glycosyltransferase family 2 protein [Gammaproteobacteria bacterium]